MPLLDAPASPTNTTRSVKNVASRNAIGQFVMMVTAQGLHLLTVSGAQPGRRPDFARRLELLDL
jgi:hypothetical protein